MKDRLAIILAALFIIWPMSVGPAQNLVNAYRDYSGGNAPQPSEVVGWLTLGVLVFQAWIFFRQAGISDRQTLLLDKQATIQHQTFIASHRAWVKVRDFRVTYHPALHTQIDFVATNRGTTDALIIGTHVELVILESPGAIYGLPRLPLKIIGGSAKLKGGQPIVHSWTDAQPMAEADVDEIEIGRKHLHVLGRIVYDDDNGSRRQTGFFRC